MNVMLTYILTSFALLMLAPAQEVKSKSIFNGEDLSGWKVPSNNIWWLVEAGILKVRSGPDKKGSVLWTEKEYSDFSIEMDFKYIEGVVDSGVHLRNMDQIQLGMSGMMKRDMTASPYIPGKGYPVEAEGVAELLKMKDWNHLKIEVLDMTYTCWLNGKKKSKGPIGLQLHGGKMMSIDFRNITLVDLSKGKKSAKVK